MTAATTIIGLLYYPMARAVMGGLMSSPVLTLIMLPYVTLGAEGFAAWLRRIWSSSGSLSSRRKTAAVVES